MNRRLPSPAMAVAFASLVIALSGTAVAAVNFAQNAGAVDGKSAVASGATLSSAAGRLVATQRTGPGRGRIAPKYLDLPALVRGSASTFGRSLTVVDNGTLVPLQIGSIPGIGSITATCRDENAAAGRLDPATTLTFANTSGDTVNLERKVDSDAATVIGLLNGTTHQFSISGSRPFQLHLERKGTNVVVSGVVRQDNRNLAGASCLVYGYSLSIPPSG